MTDRMKAIIARLKREQADGAQAARDLAAHDDIIVKPKRKARKRRAKPSTKAKGSAVPPTPAAPVAEPTAPATDTPAPTVDGVPNPGDIVTYVHRTGEVGTDSYRAETRTRRVQSVDATAGSFIPLPFPHETEHVPQQLRDVRIIDRRSDG